MSEQDNVPRSGTGAAQAPDFGAAHQQVSPTTRAPQRSKPARPAKIVVKAIPLTGFYAGLARFMSVLGIELRYSRSRRDQLLLDQLRDEAFELYQQDVESRKRIQIRKESVNELRTAATQARTASFMFLGAKGSSATTTTCVYFSAFLAEVSRTIVTAVDGNPAAGLVASRFGMNHGDTVTIQSLAADLKGDKFIQHRRFRDEMAKARPSINGVRVVGADNIIEETRRLSGEGMGDVLKLLFENSEFVTVDTANDVGDVPMRRAAEQADCYVFTANVQVRASLRMLSTTMETLRRQGPAQAKKVNHSVVVISNIPEGASAADYRKYLNEVDNLDEVRVRHEDEFKGAFIGVSHDPFLSLDGDVEIDSLNWRTQQAYIDAVIAALRQVDTLRQLKESERFSGRVGPHVTTHISEIS